MPACCCSNNECSPVVWNSAKINLYCICGQVERVRPAKRSHPDGLCALSNYETHAASGFCLRLNGFSQVQIHSCNDVSDAILERTDKRLWGVHKCDVAGILHRVLHPIS